ncbi:hypothetical protein SAMN06295879_2127 [Agreia bicolorata]|uniref:Uncharacterized protein n=1 Tax=Agreia bicolorata TaxID=110935 RepID=A0A1T4Y3Q3_9MICO|nr:hypothetical protein [Agreia bicolorata]SKA95941.1 hypothetical protein SAMN06295879_2127 [Agreia bicolorata]
MPPTPTPTSTIVAVLQGTNELAPATLIISIVAVLVSALAATLTFLNFRFSGPIVRVEAAVWIDLDYTVIMATTANAGEGALESTPGEDIAATPISDFFSPKETAVYLKGARKIRAWNPPTDHTSFDMFVQVRARNRGRATTKLDSFVVEVGDSRTSAMLKGHRSGTKWDFPAPLEAQGTEVAYMPIASFLGVVDRSTKRDSLRVSVWLSSGTKKRSRKVSVQSILDINDALTRNQKAAFQAVVQPMAPPPGDGQS